MSNDRSSATKRFVLLSAAAAFIIGQAFVEASAQGVSNEKDPAEKSQTPILPDKFTLLAGTLGIGQCIAIDQVTTNAGIVCMDEGGITIFGEASTAVKTESDESVASTQPQSGVLTQLTIIGEGVPGETMDSPDRNDVIIINRGALIGGEVLRIIRERASTK